MQKKQVKLEIRVIKIIYIFSSFFLVKIYIFSSVSSNKLHFFFTHSRLKFKDNIEKKDV